MNLLKNAPAKANQAKTLTNKKLKQKLTLLLKIENYRLIVLSICKLIQKMECAKLKRWTKQTKVSVMINLINRLDYTKHSKCYLDHDFN